MLPEYLHWYVLLFFGYYGVATAYASKACRFGVATELYRTLLGAFYFVNGARYIGFSYKGLIGGIVHYYLCPSSRACATKAFSCSRVRVVPVGVVGLQRYTTSTSGAGKGEKVVFAVAGKVLYVAPFA